MTKRLDLITPEEATTTKEISLWAGYEKLESDLLKVKLAHSRKRKAMTMLVNTRAVGIYVSKKRRKLLTQNNEESKLPKSVVFDIGNGCCQ